MTTLAFWKNILNEKIIIKLENMAYKAAKLTNITTLSEEMLRLGEMFSATQTTTREVERTSIR